MPELKDHINMVCCTMMCALAFLIGVYTVETCYVCTMCELITPWTMLWGGAGLDAEVQNFTTCTVLSCVLVCWLELFIMYSSL